MKNQKVVVIAATLLLIFGGAWILTNTDALSTGSENSITMYKNPSCQCCDKWANYLEAEGFDVTVEVPQNLDMVKNELGLPYELGSCHTGVIGDYVVEGHVPAEDIRRLMEEKPDAKGISVPGMPIGSPGMEQGNRQEPYEVILFDEDGNQSVFAEH